jgi:hypothetical protein
MDDPDPHSSVAGGGAAVTARANGSKLVITVSELRAYAAIVMERCALSSSPY